MRLHNPRPTEPLRPDTVVLGAWGRARAPCCRAAPCCATNAEPAANLHGACRTSLLPAAHCSLLPPSCAPGWRLLGVLCRRRKEGKRLRGETVLDDAVYAGRRSGRRAAFGEEKEEESEEREKEVEEGSEGGGRADLADGSGCELEEEVEEDDVEEEEGKEAGGPAAHAAGGLRPVSGSSSGGSESEEGEQEKEEEEGAAPALPAGSAAELAALEAEYAEVAAADAGAVAGLRERAAREARKALAVAAQRRLWQRGLELRILLQRALGEGNRLPRPAMRAAAVAAGGGEVAAVYAGLTADAADTLEQMCELLAALAGQNPAVAEAAAAAAGAGAGAACCARWGSQSAPRWRPCWRIPTAWCSAAGCRGCRLGCCATHRPRRRVRWQRRREGTMRGRRGQRRSLSLP